MSLKINSLPLCDGLVTGHIGVSASTRALVEFPSRAGIGFADD
jgi:hypothetical protein